MATIPTIPRETSITSSTYDVVSALEAASAVRQARHALTRAAERAYNKRRGARAAHIKRVLNAAMVNAIVTPRLPDMASVVIKRTDTATAGAALAAHGYVVWQRLVFGTVSDTDLNNVTLIAVKGQ